MLKKILVLTLGMMIVGGMSYAISTSFNITVTLRAPITLSKTSDLIFGTVETGTSTYTVNAVAGVGSPTHSAGASAQAAAFSISGESGAIATVTVPATATITSGANSITVNLTPEAGTHTFSGGAEVFYVGGDLDVTGKPAGAYSGSSTITLVYQ